jgi:hypothetical protein
MRQQASTKKKLFLYGQWVEVTVLPPQPSPSPGVTAYPTSEVVEESVVSITNDNENLP